MQKERRTGTTLTISLILLLCSSAAFAVPITERKLSRSGNGRMVSVQLYFQKAVEQVGGSVTIDYGPHSEYRTMQVPLSFYRGQSIAEVARNFCLMHKPFTYHAVGDTLYILTKKSWGRDIAVWRDAYIRYPGYNQGSLFVSPLLGSSLTLPVYDDGSAITYTTSRKGIKGAAFLNGGAAIEYMLSDTLILSAIFISYGFEALTGTNSQRGDFFTIAPALLYTLPLGDRFSVNAGAGMSVLLGESRYFDGAAYVENPWRLRDGRLMENTLNAFVQAGVKIRLIDSMHLSAFYTLHVPTLFHAVQLGISTKLFP
jgi:hypothetical protein